MRVTVVHNPEAGDDALDERDLRALLTRSGHRPDYHSTKVKGWKEALDEPADLVVAAGGDGTIAKVARRLAGRGIPLAILPAGTANNIARSLGLCRDARTLVAEWQRATPTPVDLGVVEGPMGERLFIEAAGVGVLPRLMLEGERLIDTSDSPSREQIGRGIELLRELLADASAMRCQVIVDDLVLTGDYLAVEIMNIRSIGPLLELAADADPHDGLLDVVIVREADRDAMRRFLEARGGGGAGPFTRIRSRRVEVSWDGRQAHVDADIWPDPEDDQAAPETHEPSTMRVRVEPGAVEVLM